MKLKQAIPFRHNPRIRLTLGILIAIALSMVVWGRQQGWLTSPPASQQTIECPDLAQGCSFKLRQQDYRVQLQGAMLMLEGQAAAVQANWPTAGWIWLNQNLQSPKHWTQTVVQRPAGALQLQIMVDRHQITLRTQIH